MIKNIFNEEELLTDTDNTSTDEDKEKLTSFLLMNVLLGKI